MIARMKALTLAALAPLVLMGCVLAPGKFVSTLMVNADRSFTFTYKGEVIAIDIGEEVTSGMNEAFDGAAESSDGETPQDSPSDDEDAAEKAEMERKYRAIAEALRKEAGYRSVEYMGDGLFLIDYAISGTLTHNFLFPFNSDAEVMFPFVAIELRGGDMVRVKAPGFAAGDSNGSPASPGGSEATERLDGTFTLTTDAEIVSQNSEKGVREAEDRKTVHWRATPLTKDAPMAVLRVGAVRS